VVDADELVIWTTWTASTPPIRTVREAKLRIELSYYQPTPQALPPPGAKVLPAEFLPLPIKRKCCCGSQHLNPLRSRNPHRPAIPTILHAALGARHNPISEVKRESRGKSLRISSSAKCSRWHSRRHPGHGRTAGGALVHLLAVIRGSSSGVAASERSFARNLAKAGELASGHAFPQRSDLIVRSWNLARLRFVFFRRSISVGARPRKTSPRCRLSLVAIQNHAMSPDFRGDTERDAAHLEHSVQTENRRLRLRIHIFTNPFAPLPPDCFCLKPLAQAFGLEKMFVVTMQAVLCGGYPGVSFA